MVYVTSDLHGKFDDLLSLLKMVNFGDDDFLFILGDVIDKNDGGVAIFRWVLLQTNVELLLGNHEELMLKSRLLFNEINDENIKDIEQNPQAYEAVLDWISNGGNSTIEDLKRLLCDDNEVFDELFKYLENASLFENISVGNSDFILCHAGLGNFSKDKKLEEYSSKELLWNRPSINEKYFDDSIVVFGHTPTHFFDEKNKGKMLNAGSWIDIDTGAANGGHPMLLRLDDLKEFYLEDNRMEKDVLFVGIELEKPIRATIGIEPEGYVKEYTQHITLAYKPNDEETHKYKELIEKEVSVLLNEYAVSETHEGYKAVIPDNIPYFNKSIPHITVSVANGGNPANTPCLFGEAVTVNDGSPIAKPYRKGKVNITVKGKIKFYYIENEKGK